MYPAGYIKKTHKPFKQAAGANQSNVGNVVDTLTAMMPSIPDSAGKDKTYNLTVHASLNQPITITTPSGNTHTDCAKGSTPTFFGFSCTPT